MSGHQSEIAAREARTTLFRSFEVSAIPGLLQVAGYARARFTEGIVAHGVPDDIDEAVAARMERQHVLYVSSKRFHFVFTEAALRFRMCPADVMLGQLDRLVAASALPNVRIGVVGFGAVYAASPRHGFMLLDDDRVMVETYSAELHLAQPHEIDLYSKVFRMLAGVASYADAARAIINNVVDELRAASTDDAGGGSRSGSDDNPGERPGPE